MTQKRSYTLEIVVSIAAAAIVLVGLCFHEPWLDEAQAFLIARDASVKEIIFDIPHYEGHPPLWHLIIKAVLLTGASAEVTLKIIQFVFFAAALVMFEFRSPFGKAVKLLFPFGFFFIYQYAVVARPYALLMLLMMICAASYGKRDEKPIRYIAAMILLCLCHSYGIALAGGIAAADVLKRFFANKMNVVKTFSETNKLLIASYAVLLACALFVVSEVIPANDAYGVNYKKEYGYVMAFIMCWTVIPSENLITSSFNDGICMQSQKLEIFDLIFPMIISCIVWVIIFAVCKKRKLIAEMIMPYLFLSVIMAMYVNPHHFGVFMIYAVWLFWIAADREKLSLEPLEKITSKLGLSENAPKLAVYIAAVIISAVNIGWDISCYTTEIKEPYASGRDISDYFKENDLADKKIFSVATKTNTNVTSNEIYTTNIYFDKNICMNTDKGKAYLTMRMPDEDEQNADREEWKAMGAPDVILTNIFSTESEALLFGSDKKYRITREFSYKRPFKSNHNACITYIMLSEELYESIHNNN